MTEAHAAPKTEAGRAVAQSGSGLSRIWASMAAEARFWAGVLYDARRFRRHAWLHRVRSRENRDARIMADGHFLEYGMALKDARPGFGLARARRLAGDLLAGGASPDVARIGFETLLSWAAFNAGGVPAEVASALNGNAQEAGDGNGVLWLERAEIVRETQSGFLNLARARHSVRSFAEGPVPEDAIRRAAEAAQQAPSSCNRQTCHLHVWTERTLIDRVRRHQAGNRTFGHELGGIAVITSDLRHWEHAGERYQPWIDGGLFAMNFVHALHAEGLGTCMLNWSVDVAKDKALRAEIGLGDEHLVIVLVGFGLLPERLKVCASPRRDAAACLSVNPGLAGE